MNNDSNLGIEKSFLIADNESGFEITPEEELQALQAQYNQNLATSATHPSIPYELGPLLNNLKPQTDQSETATPTPTQLKNLLSSLEAMSQGDLLLEELALEESLEQRLQDSLHQSVAEELPPLPKTAIALLKQQQITTTHPGTILQDFQTLLDFVGEQGITVSGNHHLLPAEALSDLNQCLSEPIQLNLECSQQQSYPSINGLYLLLRASGLGQIIRQGNSRFLNLNAELLPAWQSLNLTERYFTLLEAWLIRGYEEMLGERRSSLNAGSKCIQYWPQAPFEKQFSSYAEQQALNYWPEFHNLALMHLFGLLEVEVGQPEADQGWWIRRIKKSPLGDALMPAINRAYREQGKVWASEDDPTIPFGELQPTLQPYFPEWQRTLPNTSHGFQTGMCTFKISLGPVWRRIAMSSDSTLADLSAMILDSVDFDSDHLDMFRYQNRLGRTIEASHPYAKSSLSTHEVRIGDLSLTAGDSMTYIFNFSDWWKFDVQLEQVEADDPRQNYQALIASHGTAPAQYPD
ncbi:MAG: plasmid pRiA4b ORF-3 family protein [Cyanothece sp. SIO1E1]|nr:plasmid pRiA4b ORF-3 family protein [Cyanothece sp. SIO1E1]